MLQTCLIFVQPISICHQVNSADDKFWDLWKFIWVWRTELNYGACSQRPYIHIQGWCGWTEGGKWKHDKKQLAVLAEVLIKIPRSMRIVFTISGKSFVQLCFRNSVNGTVHLSLLWSSLKQIKLQNDSIILQQFHVSSKVWRDKNLPKKFHLLTKCSWSFYLSLQLFVCQQ